MQNQKLAASLLVLHKLSSLMITSLGLTQTTQYQTMMLAERRSTGAKAMQRFRLGICKQLLTATHIPLQQITKATLSSATEHWLT